MKYLKICKIVAVILLPVIYNCCSTNRPASIFPTALKCDYSANPLGVESQHPKLSWKLESDERNQVQTAYQIIVSTTLNKLVKDEGDIWDSDVVKSGQSIHNPYNGKSLTSGKRYYWKVRVWDKNSNGSDWSEPSFWEMGLLDSRDWKAKWIGYECQAAPLFRKEFSISKKIRKASVFICGLGYYELRINGMKISDHLLDPGQTDYEIRALYVVHDVTDHIERGENVIGVELGNGFYNQTAVSGGFGWEDAVYGEPRLIAHMRIWFEDGSDTLIISDENWKATAGPTYFNNLYVGDFYDARMEKSGWDEAGFDDSKWENATIVDGPGGKLVSQKLPPIRKMKTVNPVEIFNPKSGVFVFDMGQNLAGWVKLKINAKRGTEIQLRFSEEIFDDRMINMASCGGYATNVEQTDKYICKGGGEAEIWEPRFTYHGFRYVEMTGYPGKPSYDNLEGVVVYTSSQKVGDFTCSDTMINKIHNAALWTATSNIHSIITDCPTREKCGWLGDVIAEMLIYNLDVPLLLSKFVRDIETSRIGNNATVVNNGLPGDFSKTVDFAGIPWDIAPGRRMGGGHRPDWGSTFIHLPWQVYLHYGDIALASEHWQGMTLFMNHLDIIANEHIIYDGYGDMFSPGTILSIETPVALTSTAIYYYNTKIMSSMAAALNRAGEALHYQEFASKIKTAFVKKFYNSKERTFGSQSSNAIALEFGLVPKGHENDVAQSIAVDVMEKHNGHFTTGHLGSRYLYSALAEHNFGNVAKTILDQISYPSMGELFSRGATTFWESWGEKEIDENSLGVRSRNHPFQAGCDAWFFNGIGGINPDPAFPGYKRIKLDPQLVGELSYARVNYNSMYGIIKSYWKIVNGDFHWSVSIPVNTTAALHLPTTIAETVFESGVPVSKVENVEFTRLDGERTVFTVGSGNYEFMVVISK